MKTRLLLLVFALGFLFSGVCVNAQVSPAVSEKEQERVDISEIAFAKSFNGQSLESTKKFTVESRYSRLHMWLNGRVNSGRIILTLVTPAGTTFKTIEIDATSDVTYNQELNLSVGKTDWIGDWQLQIKTEKADGSYRLNIYTR
jgi:hypothetical protein